MGKNQQLDGGGQLLVFSKAGDPDAILLLFAQRSPIPSFKSLEQAIEPQGNVLSAATVEKAKGKEDGFARVYEYEVNGSRYLTLFALRVKPSGDSGNWLITLTAQAPVEKYADKAREFKEIMASFRLVYPGFT